MSDVLARAVEVLGAHVQVLHDPNVAALCSCGIGGEVRALSQIGPWFVRHQAQMLADAGLLAESGPVAGGNGAVAAEQGNPRPTTPVTVDSLTARLVAARAATDGYRSEAERLRELLDEANAKIERMEELVSSNASEPLVSLRLVPVEVFGAEDGYGLMDAVSAWSDCNRADGRIYRIDDVDPRYREPGETVEIFVRKSDLPFFERVWGDAE